MIDTLRGYRNPDAATRTQFAAGAAQEKEKDVSDTVTYTVPDMSCEHCRAAITEELTTTAGVESVDVDLNSKLVTVTGGELDDAVLRAAISEAGYEAS